MAAPAMLAFDMEDKQAGPWYTYHNQQLLSSRFVACNQAYAACICAKNVGFSICLNGEYMQHSRYGRHLLQCCKVLPCYEHMASNSNNQLNKLPTNTKPGI